MTVRASSVKNIRTPRETPAKPGSGCPALDTGSGPKRRKEGREGREGSASSEGSEAKEGR